MFTGLFDDNITGLFQIGVSVIGECIFVWFNNILSSHPIPTKRFRALKGIDEPKLF